MAWYRENRDWARNVLTLNVQTLPHAADVLATWADIGKAERLLGWSPEMTFEEGVARTVTWYQRREIGQGI